MKKYSLICFTLFALNLTSGQAAHIVNSAHHEKRIEAQTKVPTMTAKEHFAALEKAYSSRDWSEVVYHSKVISDNFADEFDLCEVAYFSGVAHFHRKNFITANKQFSQTIKDTKSPHFIEALRYKFDIAKNFSKGVKGMHTVAGLLFNERSFVERALEIFDEIILAEPSGDLAAYSHYHKALIQSEARECDRAVETFELLIRDYFKHELVPRAYVGIVKAYAKRYDDEKSKEVALLNLADLNVKKFKLAYPGHELIEEAEKALQKMREAYAFEMYTVGEYFERRGKSKAAGFYYRDVCENFPECKAAKMCEQYKKSHLGDPET